MLHVRCNTSCILGTHYLKGLVTYAMIKSLSALFDIINIYLHHGSFSLRRHSVHRNFMKYLLETSNFFLLSFLAILLDPFPIVPWYAWLHMRSGCFLNMSWLLHGSMFEMIYNRSVQDRSGNIWERFSYVFLCKIKQKENTKELSFQGISTTRPLKTCN